MKKSILLIIMLALGFSFALAGPNLLRMKSGSLLPLKNAGGSICCVLDFSKAKGNRKPLEQYIVEDYQSDMETFRRYEPEMLQWFMERWDDDIKKGPRSTTAPEADYTLHIIVKNMQLGSKSGSGGSSMSGYAEFFKAGETEPFAVVEILKMNGTIMRTPIMGYPGMKQVLSDLGEYLCDLVNHSK